MNGEVFPKILRDPQDPQGAGKGKLPWDMPSKFFPEDRKLEYTRWYQRRHGNSTYQNILVEGYRHISSDAKILQGFRSSDSNGDIMRTFNKNHSRANEQLEGAYHGDIHVLLNFPMLAINFAAYHPIFYLHHCNVDRVYEAYLAHEKSKGDEYVVENVLKNSNTRWM